MSQDGFFKSPLGDLGVNRMSRDGVLQVPFRGFRGKKERGFRGRGFRGEQEHLKGFKIEQIFTKTTIPT